MLVHFSKHVRTKKGELDRQIAAKEEEKEWDELYGEKSPKTETVTERLQRYQKDVSRQQTEQNYYYHKNRGAR